MGRSKEERKPIGTLYFSKLTMKDQMLQEHIFYINRRAYEKPMQVQIILTKGNFNTNPCHDAHIRLSLKPRQLQSRQCM